MKLDDISTTLQSEFQFKHPKTKEPLDLWITFLGPEHEKRKALSLQRAREARLRVRKARDVGAMFDVDPLEAQTELTKTIAACTASWRSGVGADVSTQWELGGEKLDCTPANVERVLNEPKLAWLRGQAVEFFAEDDAFTTGSPEP